MDDGYRPAAEAGQSAPMTPLLKLIAQGDEHRPPVRSPANRRGHFACPPPPCRVVAKAAVERVEREQVTNLEAWDPSLIEAVQLGGELADGLQARSGRHTLEHLVQRACVE
jgi:hypothetical protein